MTGTPVLQYNVAACQNKVQVVVEYYYTQKHCTTGSTRYSTLPWSAPGANHNIGRAISKKVNRLIRSFLKFAVARSVVLPSVQVFVVPS